MLYKQFKKIIKNLLKFLLEAVTLVLGLALNLTKLIGQTLLKALVEYGDMRLKHHEIVLKHRKREEKTDINQKLYEDKTDIVYIEREEKQ
tara:strand:- start:65 stop:334 length:270 start_codon:yes stop_codon:yes gene_type:complete